ncbi:U6 snRNA phosphodiesterase 1 isoform X2 [Diorhabda sublineata]|uniref:U6 snRNA phosphodiesterase 1 isoform X2 n=1 Tax=Diorhabda sublineata TaxID=1163346 RepID=UPI0024E16578|nr:U6 snRNA phosphodiesterase 1 isoform X2 [Diorhabda sublineata]
MRDENLFALLDLNEIMFKNGSLSLLKDYGEDSSDDDVPGPRVSTKRTFKEENESTFFKKKLPVPEVLLKCGKPVEDHVDDPLLHGGRLRSFGHERANKIEGIKDLVEDIVNMVPNIPLYPVEEFHISLTKTVILKHHWITSFMESIKLRTNYFNKFMILFSILNIYCNEERTRTFVGLQIKSGYDSLIRLVDILNLCLEEFKLPPFYKDPSFHMSIVWCVGDHEEELNSLLSKLNSKLQDLMEAYSQDCWYIYVNTLMCKSGNKLFKFDLS